MPRILSYHLRGHPGPQKYYSISCLIEIVLVSCTRPSGFLEFENNGVGQSKFQALCVHCVCSVMRASFYKLHFLWVKILGAVDKLLSIFFSGHKNSRTGVLSILDYVKCSQNVVFSSMHVLCNTMHVLLIHVLP